MRMTLEVSEAKIVIENNMTENFNVDITDQCICGRCDHNIWDS
jgi:hypothetical protein